MEVVALVLGVTMTFSKAIIAEHRKIGRRLNEFISMVNVIISMALILLNKAMEIDSFTCGLLFAVAFFGVSELITSVAEDARRREEKELKAQKRMQIQREYRKVS